jgi:hypothetical protein
LLLLLTFVGKVRVAMLVCGEKEADDDRRADANSSCTLTNRDDDSVLCRPSPAIAFIFAFSSLLCLV